MSPLKQHPQYLDSQKEIDDLNAALFKVRSRISEIEAALSSVAAAPDSAALAASALEFAATGVVKPSNATSPGLREELAVLMSQRSAVESLVGTKLAALEALTRELSKEVCNGLQQKHRQYAARYAEVMAQLDAIQEEEEAFVLQIARAGYEPQFTERVCWHLVGSFKELGDSAAYIRHRQLRGYGNAGT